MKVGAPTGASDAAGAVAGGPARRVAPARVQVRRRPAASLPGPRRWRRSWTWARRSVRPVRREWAGRPTRSAAGRPGSPARRPTTRPASPERQPARPEQRQPARPGSPARRPPARPADAGRLHDRSRHRRHDLRHRSDSLHDRSSAQPARPGSPAPRPTTRPASPERQPARPEQRQPARPGSTGAATDDTTCVTASRAPSDTTCVTGAAHRRPRATLPVTGSRSLRDRSGRSLRDLRHRSASRACATWRDRQRRLPARPAWRQRWDGGGSGCRRDRLSGSGDRSSSGGRGDGARRRSGGSLRDRLRSSGRRSSGGLRDRLRGSGDGSGRLRRRRRGLRDRGGRRRGLRGRSDRGGRGGGLGGRGGGCRRGLGGRRDRRRRSGSRRRGRLDDRRGCRRGRCRRSCRRRSGRRWSRGRGCGGQPASTGTLTAGAAAPTTGRSATAVEVANAKTERRAARTVVRRPRRTRRVP